MSAIRLASDCEILGERELLVLIVRHAETQVHPGDGEEDSISISQKGRKDSENFGKELIGTYHQIGLIKSSPVRRCMSTAEAILIGANQDLKVSLSRTLGNPGAFVVDDTAAIENFQRYGVRGVVQRQLEGRNLAGMRTIGGGVNLLLKEICEDLESLNGLGLYVTHDAVLVPFVGYLTNKFTVSNHWFGFLNGIGVWKKDDDRLFLSWIENVFDITDFVVGSVI